MCLGLKIYTYHTIFSLINLCFSCLALIFLSYTILQVKLFKEWSAKWPEENKIKLKEKICEIDAAFSEKLNQEILNGYNLNGNGTSGTSSPTDQAPPIAELQNGAIVA